MPYRQTPATHTPYAIIAFDKQGAERNDDPDGIKGLISARLLSEAQQTSPSDFFIFSHGWRGDIDGAISQYDRWIDAQSALTADVAKMGSAFQPVRIGLHWPSEPWGDEELKPASTSFDISAGLPPSNVLEAYVDRLDLQNSLEARELVGKIFRENQTNAGAITLPKPIGDAYQRLAQMIDYSTDKIGGDPASDNAPFDPQTAFDAMNAAGASFGLGSLGGLLGPLRVLTFWTMKRRARTVGEGGIFQFVSNLQNATPHSRIHLIGHSFGCIVVSSICGGPKGQTSLPRPVDSLTLLQGAVSFWSYANAIPSTGGKGYYNSILDRHMVRGPIVTTRSNRDYAVNVFYPAAVGLILQDPSFGVDLTNAIPWGAIGAFGIHGVPGAVSMPMQEETSEYHFEPGKIYNLEASKYIAKLSGPSGAHSDIAEPQVMHALWQAAYSAATAPLAQPAVAAQPAVMTMAAGAGAGGGQSVPMPPPPVRPPSLPTAPATALDVSAPLKDTDMPIPFGVHVNGSYLPQITKGDLDFIGKDSARAVLRSAVAKGTTFGVAAEIDPDNLAKAGWGIIFAASADAGKKRAILQALDPLLQLRKKQAGGTYEDGGRFRVFDNETGYQDGVEVSAWLDARGVGQFSVNPAQGVPYYLLLVGAPTEIPFDFQYGLDSFFAVGRLYFEAPEEYATYAANIVKFEAGEASQSKTIALFNTRNDGDRPTSQLHDQVAVPLVTGAQGFDPLGALQGFSIKPYLADNATKANLVKILRGDSGGVPALMFSGSHGVDFGMTDPTVQKDNQGALLTQDWPGQGSEVDPAKMCFAGTDIPAGADLNGMIYFLFACYGVACPQFDDYSHTDSNPMQIAAEPIITRLPQKLLLAGAQAVIGHVDRAWAYSFQNQLGQSMFQGFRDPLTRLLQGRRIGEAMDCFDQRWAALTTELMQLVVNRKATGKGPDALLANRWVARDDARNYIVLGDPAARLRTTSTGTTGNGAHATVTTSSTASSFGVSIGPATAGAAAPATSFDIGSFAIHADAKPHLDFKTFSGAFDMQAAVSPDCSYQLVEAAVKDAVAGSKVDAYIYSITAPFLIDLLRKAHDRGVEIRVMYDPAQMKKEFADQLRAFLGENIRVAPSHDPRRVFTVCHQKFAVIDEKTVVLESANWDPNSIPEREPGQPRKKGNREWVLRVDDENIAEWYGRLFEADWQIPQQETFGVELARPVAPLSFRGPRFAGTDFPLTHFSGQSMEVLPLTSPDNYFDSIFPLLQGAQKRIFLQQQYIQGGGGPSVPRLLEAIARRKADQNIDVRIIISSRFPQAWEQSKSTLQEAGLLEDLRAINLDFFVHCHNKGVIVDDSVVVSSTNWSENSIRRAREAGMLIHSEAVTGFYASVFQDDWKTGWTVATADSQAAAFSVPVTPGEGTVQLDPTDQV